MAITSTSKLIDLTGLQSFKTKYTETYVGDLKKKVADSSGKLPGEEGYVDTEGLATVKEYVDAAKASATFDPSTLKNTDAAVAHEFVTAAVEENGIVTVSRAALVADDIPSLTLAKISDAGSAAAKDAKASAIADADAETATLDETLVNSAQVVNYVKAKTADLEGALHFRGIKTATSEITDPKSGDVVIVGTTEYIYDGTSWAELGDEGNYVPKTRTVAGIDLVDNVTKAEMLTALNVADGAQVNVLESVKVNGTALTIDDSKAVDVLVATGSTNGTIAVNSVDVAVKGLGSAAYVETSTLETAGAAAEVRGSTTETVASVDAKVEALTTATEAEILDIF